MKKELREVNARLVRKKDRVITIMVRVLIVSTTKVNLLPYEEAYAYEEVDG